MKAYKVFDYEWKCRGFQYEVGKEYKHDGDIMLCKSGFHACLKLSDCFSYYNFDPENKVAEVEIIGKRLLNDNDSKIVTDQIKIIKELTWSEVLSLCNTGIENTGFKNSGDYNLGHHNSGHCNSGRYNSGYYNSGDYNSGSYNSGDHNSAHYNSGHHNSGDHNSGSYNSGYYNSGHHNSDHHNSGDHNSGRYNSGYYNSGDHNSGSYNSGYYNSGDHNSGSYNSGDYNSGVFNYFNPEKIYCFDKLLSFDEFEKIIKSEGYEIIKRKFKLVKFRSKSIKSGSFKYFSYKSCWKIFWNNLKANEKLKIKKIPFMEKDVFFDITGIKL